ncbi:MAG: hypothetical protein ACK5NB_06665 [Flavobacteriaceae bacterium]
MKRIFIAAIALISLQGFAQEEKKERPNRGEMMERMNDYTPEEMATLRTKKMTLDLDLNQSQQDDVYKLNLENAKTHKAMMEQFKAKRENADAEKPTKEERLKMANAQLDRQIELKAKMKSILNEDQYAKWEANRDQMGRRAKGMKPSDGKRNGNKKGKKS